MNPGRRDLRRQINWNLTYVRTRSHWSNGNGRIHKILWCIFRVACSREGMYQLWVWKTDRKNCYSQLSPYEHPAMTDTPIIRTAPKSRAKINYGRLTEINSRCNGRARQHKILLYSVTKRLKSITNLKIRGPKPSFGTTHSYRPQGLTPFRGK